MKKLITTISLCCFGLMAAAQAVLPTSWNFATTTLPSGWTTTGTDYYSASGNPAPAMKFDGTGDELVIHFGSNPGVLKYDIVGNSFANGTFTVEESDLGTTWTALRTFSGTLDASYTQKTDVPQASTRYIRFKYTLKSAGNVGIDNVSIEAGAATPEQEINVKYSGTTVLNNGTASFNSPVGTSTPISFTIENLGTANTLNVSGAAISGSAAADYTVATTTPLTVNANGTATLTVNFTPSVAGTRPAVLTIASNDADEASYVINLNGIGGAFASEPAAQPTALTFSNVKTYRMNGSFSAASPSAEGYLVLIKEGSDMTAAPVDGEVYERGDIIGDARVVQSGSATAFVPVGTLASSTYYVKVFAYNGNGVYRNYVVSSPAMNNVSTPATMAPANYYSTISTTSPTFVTDLHNLINPHTAQFYSNYASLMINKFAARDTVDGQKVITCVYSGENKVYTPPFDFSSNNFSREHTYCYSWMPTTGATDTPEYNDYHHLFPTNQDDANAVRSNYPLGNVATVQSTYLGAKSGLNAAGKRVYEPRDAHKGDAARAMMYMSVCYNGVSGNNWSFPSNISGSIPYGQDQLTMKQWALADVPDKYEMTRNDYVDSLQHNRNPFVDHPEYICYVNFSNMAYEAAGCGSLQVDELLGNSFLVFPNPAKTEVNLHVDGTTILGYVIFDMQGRVVASELSGADQTLVKVPVASLRSGAYVINATTPYGIAQKQLIIE